MAEVRPGWCDDATSIVVGIVEVAVVVVDRVGNKIAVMNLEPSD